MRQKDPLRPLTSSERRALEQLVRSHSAPALSVTRARALLAVSDGSSYTDAARLVGRSVGDSIAQWVARFNQVGLAAVERQPGGRPPTQYGPEERERILAEFRRPPDRERDGTATWSLNTLQRALRRAPGWLAEDQHVHHLGGAARCRDHLATRPDLVRDRGRYPQAQAWRGQGPRRGRQPEKRLIEQAYTEGERLGLAVWGMDEAGQYQAIPQPGVHWQPIGRPARYPHEHVRHATAKLPTLFHPATGQVRVKGVTSCPNVVLHAWLEAELSSILASLPPPRMLREDDHRAAWERWQAGLTVKPTLPDELPPLRMLLVMDNLAGHLTARFVVWLFDHGIMPLYTPLSGSWLNMTAHHCWPRTGRSDAGQLGRIDRMAGDHGASLEHGPHTLRVGRQTPSSRLPTAPSTWRIRSLYSQTNSTPTPVHGTMATFQSSDPLVVHSRGSHARTRTNRCFDRFGR